MLNGTDHTCRDMAKKTQPGESDADDSVREFLNPKAALTPGIAGGLTMLITNTLHLHFALPPQFVGLGISFLFALLVFFAARRIKLSHRLIYLVLNTPGLRQQVR